MQSLESLTKRLEVDKSKLEAISPGSFVVYHDEKKKSSHVTLAASGGIISKEKQRMPQKALYEFLALRAWNEVLAAYSQSNPLTFRAPKPLGLYGLETGKPGILMEFIPGYELKKLCVMKRSTPVHMKGQKTPVPLYPACAYHLGALNGIKEAEGLFHDDYDERHVIFSPIHQPGIGVIDVENSRFEPSSELVRAESEKVLNLFHGKTSSEKDRLALSGWYQQGRESLVVPDSSFRLSAVLERIAKEYDVDFDFCNKKINGTQL